MKNSLTIIGALFLTLTFGPTRALANDPIELAVDHVFIPEHGYDDNDVIQLVVYGNLPNACYTLGETKVETEGHTITVRQFATKNTSQLCTQSVERLPPHIMSLVPYTVEVNLGIQKSGEYRVGFWDSVNGKVFRNYQVTVAETKEVDSQPYAAVSNAMLPDVVFKGEKVYLTFSGVYQNTCTEIDKVIVKRENDVFVVLPILKVYKNEVCIQALTPFKYKVLIAQKLRTGEYMVHMRSKSGRAVNRVFTVLPNP